MNLKHIFFAVLLLSFSLNYAQDRLEGQIDSNKVTKAKNLVYFELLGKGLFYSINYERSLIKLGEKASINASIGFSIFDGMTQIRPSKDFFIPLEVNIVHDFKNHHLSYGVGSTYWNYEVNDLVIHKNNLPIQPLTVRLKTITEWFGHINLEYRYQKPTGGMMYKAGITPLFFDKMQNFEQVRRNYLSANLGIGYAF